MNDVTMRFTRDQLIEALEGRRKWAEKLDRDNLVKHKREEREHLAKFRAVCREALGWDYETARRKSFVAEIKAGGSGFYRKLPPSCPRSVVADLDRQLNYINTTAQKTFVVRERGSWDRVFWLLTHDETIPTGDMC